MSWPEVKLSKVIEYIRGVTFKPSQKMEPYSEGSVVCFTTANVQDELDITKLTAIEETVVKNDERFIRPGDLLISSANSWDLVGKTIHVPDLDYKATAGGFIGIIRPTNIDSRYLYYWITSSESQVKIRHLGRKTTNISNLSIPRFLNLKIPLPSLDEQKRIASILDKADEIKRASVKTKELKKMMIDCIFREMFGEYFADDKHAMEIENVANFIDYRGKTPPRVQAGIPLINAKCVRPGYFLKEKIDFIEKDTYSKIMTRGYPVIGDVLFTTEGATMGYTCRIPEGFDEFSVGQRLITLQTKENYNSIVLEYMLNSIEVQGKINQSATGSAAKGIRSARFAKIRIPCPPIDLQNKFASIVRKIERSNLGNISDYSTNLANSLTQEILT